MSKSAPIDLADFSTTTACDKGFELELRHPATKAPLGVFLTVLGKDSKTFKDHIRSKTNERLRKDMMARNRGKDAEPSTVEQIERETIELLSICTLGWRTGDAPTITMGGKVLEFSEANARLVYAEEWIRNQADEAIGDLGNFLPS